jgi:hypothetical protein
MTATLPRATSSSRDVVDAITDNLVTSVPGLTRVGDLHLEMMTSRCRLSGSAYLVDRPITWQATGRDLAGAIEELRSHLRRLSASLRPTS